MFLRVILTVFLMALPFASNASCGFFEPKVTFSDGSNACLSEFPFFSRKRLLQSFPDHIQLAIKNRDYAIATPANPARCPFIRVTSWGDGAPPLPRCQQRMDDAIKNSDSYKDCRCDVLIDSGKTKLNRAEFVGRLASFEHYLNTNMTQEETRIAEVRKAEEERQARENREAEERKRAESQQREENERKNKEIAKREEEERKRANQVVVKPAPQIPSTTVYAVRKALVIGNDSYKGTNVLQTAREDARSIAAELRRVGYSVTLQLDLAERGMKTALRNFVEQINGGDEVAIFFAGHGVQIENSNYLIPVDIEGESPRQVRDEAIDLNRILGDLEERRPKFTLAIIDACRNNPFNEKWDKNKRGGASRGLAPTTAATGQMIIFSAGANQKALDSLTTPVSKDPNKNGVFTRVFIKHMQRPSVSINEIAEDTKEEVVLLARKIGHDQVPAVYNNTVGKFFFTK